MPSILATRSRKVQANAEALGLNHSPKLTFGNVGRAARQGYLDNELVRIPLELAISGLQRSQSMKVTIATRYHCRRGGANSCCLRGNGREADCDGSCEQWATQPICTTSRARSADLVAGLAARGSCGHAWALALQLACSAVPVQLAVLQPRSLAAGGAYAVMHGCQGRITAHAQLIRATAWQVSGVVLIADMLPMQIAHWEAGDVDFSPEHELEPGNETPFPPSTAEPGAVGAAHRLTRHEHTDRPVAVHADMDLFGALDGDLLRLHCACAE